MATRESIREKVFLGASNLHAWMCLEASAIFIANWTDVAVHDRTVIDGMRQGDTGLWIASNTGSVFYSMFSPLDSPAKSAACVTHSHIFDNLKRIEHDVAQYKSSSEDLRRRTHDFVAKKFYRFAFVTKTEQLGENWRFIVCELSLSGLLEMLASSAQPILSGAAK